MINYPRSGHGSALSLQHNWVIFTSLASPVLKWGNGIALSDLLLRNPTPRNRVFYRVCGLRRTIIIKKNGF
ncbi:hypothetical protein QUA54_32715 [Microcoleus sp. MOSTC5]|uniref:hypothetical protein n=1 Tax=Microcoleus sp. MOSTC5 TaxID=3055378 RepID=UPI002FD5F8C9